MSNDARLIDYYAKRPANMSGFTKSWNGRMIWKI